MSTNDAEIAVLLVEDVTSDAKLIERELATAQSRFSVVSVSRLREAEQQLRRRKFDVILCDLALPDSDPPATILTIGEAAPGVPIIVLTSLTQEDLAPKLLDQGAQDHLLKDEITPAALDRSIRYSIQRHQWRRETQRLLSEVKQSRNLLQRKNRRLAKLFKTAQRFVSNVSHEFRTPLTVVKEYTDLLRNGLLGDVNAEQRRYLDIITDRADDLNRMVDDMLDVSRIEVGLLGAWRCECRFHEVLEHVRPSLVNKAELKGVQLEFDVPDDLPPVYCDTEKIGRVIVNLAVNAIKFCSDPGVVRISARFDSGSGEVVVGVTDNGPGIDRECQQLIFQRFKQLGTVSRGSTKGFGLGLNIAQELVELNFGQMSLESERGQGSTFLFTLPPADVGEVIRRYVLRLQRRRDDNAYVSLVNAFIDCGCDTSLADDVDAFLNYQLRRNDLLFRTGVLQWLLIVPEPKSEMRQLFNRIAKQRDETNRNRPRGPLPAIHWKRVGSWPLHSEVSQILDGVDTCLRDKELAHA